MEDEQKAVTFCKAPHGSGSWTELCRQNLLSGLPEQGPSAITARLPGQSNLSNLQHNAVTYKVHTQELHKSYKRKKNNPPYPPKKILNIFSKFKASWDFIHRYP